MDHHEFFLQDSEGREKSFKTVNWDFPCRDGHVLSVKKLAIVAAAFVVGGVVFGLGALAPRCRTNAAIVPS